MELRECIKSSLVEISRGVLDASKELKDTNAFRRLRTLDGFGVESVLVFTAKIGIEI